MISFNGEAGAGVVQLTAYGIVHYDDQYALLAVHSVKETPPNLFCIGASKYASTYCRSEKSVTNKTGEGRLMAATAARHQRDSVPCIRQSTPVRDLVGQVNSNQRINERDISQSRVNQECWILYEMFI